jgi:hypothetical protein
MTPEPNEKYTNSALRIGDADPYPQRLVGEFIGTVVSNTSVNDEYKHVVPTPGRCSTCSAPRPTAPRCGCAVR